ncbi:MAG TPA: AMP-binding protein [Steroidobacter sp.]
MARCPDEIALSDGVRSFRYRDAAQWVNKVACALRADPQLSPDMNVAIYCPNDARVLLLMLAVNRADMAWVGVHARNAVATNIAVLDQADVEVVFFHSDFESVVGQLRMGLAKLRKLICIDRESTHGPHLESWLAENQAALQSTPEDPQRRSFIQPTGGTTGPAKGAEHSHRSLEMGLLAMVDGFDIEQSSRHLIVAPLTHAAGAMAMAFLISGAQTVILPGFDPALVLSTIARERITHLFLPPTALYALLAHADVQRTDVSSLRALIVGTAPVAPERYAEAIRVLGPVIYEAYGQSECMFPVLIKKPADYIRADGTFDEAVLRASGRPLRYAVVEIMSEDGEILPPGHKGEIVVRSSMVMKGYYQRPQETAEVCKFDWHHTTDIGVKDERSFFTIVDRKKDMIVSGGFNIYPVEIEAVILSHPAVQDCAVIGVPDPKWGEAVRAVLQLKPGRQVTAEEIIALCKERLGSVKAPKAVEVWPHLPRSVVGKVLKSEIRKRFWEGHWRQV